MTGDEMKKYWNWLVTVEDMWFDKIRVAMEYFNNPKELYEADEKELLESGAFTLEDVLKIQNSKSKNLDEELDKLDKMNIKLTYVGAADYPKKLLDYPDRPPVLYYKGDLPKMSKSVAIVGARNCSAYGKSISESFAHELAQNGINIISGMARGVDKYSHMGCINAGVATYAILGCGVDICYPRENIELYTNIQKCGGIISEYPPGAQALPWRFPYRNRIISMLSDALLVVEAKEKSGTLITVDYALAYGKDVFAVPGRINDALSMGCNKLIKSGAFVCTEAEDILVHLGVEKNKNKIKNNILLEKDFEVVYSLLCLHPVGVENIVLKTGLNIGRVYEILMKLRMDGMIEEVFNGHYIRKLQ